MSGNSNHPGDESPNDALNDALSRITASLVAQTLTENDETDTIDETGSQKDDLQPDESNMESPVAQDNSEDDSPQQANEEAETSQSNMVEDSFAAEKIDKDVVRHANEEDNNNEYGDYNDVISNLVGNIFGDIAKTTEKDNLDENNSESIEADPTEGSVHQSDSQKDSKDTELHHGDSQLDQSSFLENSQTEKIVEIDDIKHNPENDNTNNSTENDNMNNSMKNATQDGLGVIGMEDAISKIVSETVQQISSTTTYDQSQTNDMDIISQSSENLSSNPAEKIESTMKLQNERSSGKSLVPQNHTKENSIKSTISDPVEFNMDEVIAQAVRNTIEATAQVDSANLSAPENSKVSSSENNDNEQQINLNRQVPVVDSSTSNHDVSQSDLLISGAVNEIIKQAVQHSSSASNPSTSTSNNEESLIPDLFVEDSQIHNNEYDANNFDDDVNIAQVVSNVVEGIQHLNAEDSQAALINSNVENNVESNTDDISSQKSQLGSSQLLADAAIAQIVQNVVSAVSDASNKKFKKPSKSTAKRQSSTARSKKTAVTAAPQRKIYPSIPLIGVTRPSTISSSSSKSEQPISDSNDVDEFQAAMDEMIRSVADAIISDNHNRSATPITLATAQQLNRQQAERQQREQKKKQQDSLLKKKKKQELSKQGKAGEQDIEKRSKPSHKQSKALGSNREKTPLTDEEKKKKKEAKQLQKQQEKLKLREAKKSEKSKKSIAEKRSENNLQVDVTAASSQEAVNLEQAIDEVVNNVIDKSFGGISIGSQIIDRKRAYQANDKPSAYSTTSNVSGSKSSKKRNPTLIDPEILKKREIARTEIEKRKKARELKKEETKKKQLEKAELKAQKLAKALQISKEKEEKKKQFEEAKKKQEEAREKAKLEKEKALEQKAKLKEAKEKKKREKLERREERRKKKEEKERVKAEKEKLRELKMKEREERKKLEDEKQQRKEERKKKKEEELRVKQEKIRLKEEKIKLSKEKASRREERKILKEAKFERRQERIRLKEEREAQKLERAKLKEEKLKLKQDKIKRREERRQKKLRAEQLKKDKQLRRALGTSYSSSRVIKPTIADRSSLSDKSNITARSNSPAGTSAIESAIVASSSVLVRTSKNSKQGRKKHSKKDKTSKLSKYSESDTLSEEQKHARAMAALANEYASTPYLKDLLTKHLANNSFAAGLDLNVLSSRIAAGLSKFREYMNNGSLAADLSAQSSRAPSNHSDNETQSVSSMDIANDGNSSTVQKSSKPSMSAIVETPGILGSHSNITEVIADIKRRAAASVSQETESKAKSPPIADNANKQVYSNSSENKPPKFSKTISSIVDRIIHRDEATDVGGSNNSSQAVTEITHSRKYTARSDSYSDDYRVDIDLVRPLKRKSTNDISSNTSKRPSIKRAKYNSSGEPIYDNGNQEVSGVKNPTDEEKAKFYIPKLKSIGSYNHRHSPNLAKPNPLHNRAGLKNVPNLEEKTKNGFSSPKFGARPSLAAVFAINSGRSASTSFGKLKMKNNSENDQSSRKIDPFRRHSYKSLS